MMALAQAQFVPYVAAQAEHDSNVFDISSAGQALLEYGDTRRDDTVLRYLGGANARYQIGQQTLHATLEGRRFDYLHFSQLNHYEYLLDGGLDWTLSKVLDGAVDFRQERSMTPFSALSAPQLELQTDRSIGARFNLAVTPDWLLLSGIKNHELDAPVQGTPGFGLRENSNHLDLSYLNLKPFSACVYAEYLRGNYVGIIGPDQYNQATLALTATYVISGLSNVSANFGYSERKDQTVGPGYMPGYTGSLSYIGKLTEKTRVHLQLFRVISSSADGSNTVAGANVSTGSGTSGSSGGSTGAVVGTGAVVASGFNTSVNWQATFKIAVDADYSLTDSTFEGQGVTGDVESKRKDQDQVATLRISYRPVQWLRIVPFFSYEDRFSHQPGLPGERFVDRDRSE